MKVDFLIFFEKTKEFKLHEMLSECLQMAYADNYDEPPKIDQLDFAIDVRYVRGHLPKNDATDMEHADEYIAGFSVDFDAEEVETGTKIVNAFCQELSGRTEEGIRHVLKLNDPYLQMRNRKYADEIFEIEMKLREAISLIFIDTYGSEFYNLLREIKKGTTPADIEPKQMSAHYENEFFFMLFSDYIDLNERKLPNNAKDIIQLISDTDDFDALKKGLTSKPISKEEYVDFLSSLNKHVNPIEKVRNCIAHNRTIPQSVINDYETAKTLLLKSIDGLIGYPNRDDVGLWWEEDAIEAAKRSMEDAKWDFENGTVEIIVDRDLGRSQTCESYDELFEAVREIASDEANASMPFDEGEAVFPFDEWGAAESILQEYEEQMKKLGWEL